MLAALSVCVAHVHAVAGGEAADLTFDRDVRPFLESYCIDCHNDKKTKGGLNLKIFDDESSLYQNGPCVDEIVEVLAHKEMPPEDELQPEDALRSRIADWLEFAMDNVDYTRFRNAGFMPSHHLTRLQYRNTIRDLVGVGMEVVDGFPVDEATHGFDSIGDVQDVSPVHMERYLDAANFILDSAFLPESSSWVFDPRELDYVRLFGLSDHDGKVRFPEEAPDHEVTGAGHVIYHTGGLTMSHAFPHTGTYHFKVKVWGHKPAEVKDGPGLILKLDAHKVGRHGTPTDGPGKTRELSYTAVVRAGVHDIKFEMENMGVVSDAAKAANESDWSSDLNSVAIDSIAITGPVATNGEETKGVVDRLLFLQPGAGVSAGDAARQVVGKFASRAFRRPVKPDELDQLLSFYATAIDRGDSFADSIKLAMKAVLISPNFLFHIEQGQKTGEAARGYRITDFELASRLSYFIWGSMPDDELFALAGSGELHEPDVLRAQTLRMLADEKSIFLAESFAPQWLGLGSLFSVHRDGRFHPNNVGERQMLLDETVNFFDHIVREDRSVMDLIDADYVFVNESLAGLYRIDEVKGREFRKVALTEEKRLERGGVIGMASVHMSVSHPKDTNPSGRGKWVLDVLLGSPPPPPPPDVPLLPKQEKDGPKLTLRERLSLHRENPNCASCHAKIDPIGFAMENYNNYGKWRQDEDGLPLDVSGELPDGHRINGPADLRKYIVDERRDQFLHNLTERLSTFALRRGLEFYDEGPVREIVVSIEENDDRMSALILGIVNSYPFQFRQEPEL